MAEERIEMPLTPETIDLRDGSFTRNSLTPEIIGPKVGNLMRSSTGTTSTSSGGEKIVPHYLRASTGSCHDFCKYGRQHAFERKGKHPTLKGKKSMSDEVQHPIKSVSPLMRIRKPEVKSTSSPDSGTQIRNASEINKHSRIKKPAVKSTSSLDPGIQIFIAPEINKEETKTVKKKALSPANKIANVAKSSAAVKPKRVAERSHSSPLNSSSDQSTGKDTDVKTGGKNSATSKIDPKKYLVLPRATLHPKPSINRITSVKTQKHRALKGASPQKNENKVRKDESVVPIDEIVSEKTLYVIEPKPETKILETDPTEGRRLASLSSPSRSTSPPPSLGLHEKEASIESGSYETETETEYDETETESEYDETGSQNQLVCSKEEYKRRPRRAGTVHPEDNDPGHKLKFRRGKVVDLQSENDAPRRLKFRKGRVLGDEQNGKGSVRRKSFRKREVSDEATADKPKSENVVLRHQDVNGKKDTQGLFNNVIEETASKLVETRKSKVKALVGAFETVISLQENKPSATSSG